MGMPVVPTQPFLNPGMAPPMVAGMQPPPTHVFNPMLGVPNQLPIVGGAGTGMMSMMANAAMVPPPMPPPIPPPSLGGVGVVSTSTQLFNNQQQQQHSSLSSTTAASMQQQQSTYNPSAPADVNTLNVVNQLLLLNAERLKQATSGGGGATGSSHTSTPDTNNTSRGGTSAPGSPHHHHNFRNASGSSGVAGSPTRSKPLPTLPTNWKTATDADGRVYYYHTVTRETSWDPPPAPKIEERPSSPKRIKKTNRPSSPRIAAADTTHKSGPRTPPSSKSPISSSSLSLSSSKTGDLQKIRDAFKAKISSVVVNCLNSYQKVDCKQGRIKCIEDFKFLARKLTHGLIMKERQRVGKEEMLTCNDSVKIKVKEYIRNYMKKFGALYIRS